jgi:methylated-DNA-[protein]-cysteine S-methyltransferase
MHASTPLLLDHLDTPIGRLALLASEEGHLRGVGFTDHHSAMHEPPLPHPATGTRSVRLARDPGGLTSALRAYFDGDLGAIAELPAEADGTAFQLAVWQALREIPSGETRSYGDIARRIGKPRAVRAVGLANGSNPIAIVVPCHRVIGSNGSLTGYGGGLDRKRWLLAHERAAGPHRQLTFPLQGARR